jgi:hypothetical protein
LQELKMKLLEKQSGRNGATAGLKQSHWLLNSWTKNITTNKVPLQNQKSLSSSCLVNVLDLLCEESPWKGNKKKVVWRKVSNFPFKKKLQKNKIDRLAPC